MTDIPTSSVNDAQRITVIMNPVAGLKSEAQDIIKAYLAALPDRQITYYFTEKKGDAVRFAQEAVAANAQVVLGYGGDGTMTEVAAGLQHSGVPMAILPGGTANVMAIELGIPIALQAALDLIFHQPNYARSVDMGCIDNQMFLLRAGIGYEAQLSATAPRAAKREHGRLAYFQHGFALLKKLRPARYKITTGGKTYVVSGITCMICNSTNVGINNLQLVHQSSVSDGLLDVVVIEGLGVKSLMRVFASIFQKLIPGRAAAPPAIRHWQVPEVTIEISPRQLVAFDGEKLKYAKRVSAVVVPNAVLIIVPDGAPDSAKPVKGTL